MALSNYRDLRKLCAELAASVGIPRFYLERASFIERSREAFEGNSIVGKCLEIADRVSFAGHGRTHIRKVAVESGAIVLIEAGNLPDGTVRQRLVFLAHIAGVLHDIKRSGPDHARLGATEAGRLLAMRREEMAIDGDERGIIMQAIANHEAFQPVHELRRPDAQLLSNALYDADKFRWGPENFTDTLWDLLEARGVENIAALFNRFPSGMEGIKRIRDTFRTPVGKVFGPDFIDRGLEIGARLYKTYMDQAS